MIGTDINPRAIALARANATLNGIGNVEFRAGNLYEPVQGDEFDLIVSQPPYYPALPGSEKTFLHGGPRGDELSRTGHRRGTVAHHSSRARADLCLLARGPDTCSRCRSPHSGTQDEPSRTAWIAAEYHGRRAFDSRGRLGRSIRSSGRLLGVCASGTHQ